MLTKQIGFLTAYRRDPKPSALPPALLAAALATLAHTGGLSLPATAGLAASGILAGCSLSLLLWAQAWVALTEQGWRPE
jgi:hypothetical protein